MPATKQDINYAIRVMQSCENAAQLLTAEKYLKTFSGMHPDEHEAITEMTNQLRKKSIDINHAESLRC